MSNRSLETLFRNRRCGCNVPCKCPFGIGNLRDVWNDIEVGRLMGNPRPSDECPEEIPFFRSHLVRTVSLLLYLGIPDSKLRPQIKYWVEKEMRDDQLLDPTQTYLRDLLTEEGKDYMFDDMKHLFTAPVIEEGRDEELGPGQVMPLQGKQRRMGMGMNGEVVSQYVAKGHLVLKSTVSYASIFLERTEDDLTCCSKGLAPNRVKVAKKTLRGPNREEEIKILKNLRAALDKEKEIPLSTCIIIFTLYNDRDAYSLSLCAESNLETKFRELVEKDCFKACLVQIKEIAGAIEFLHRTQPPEEPAEQGEQKTCYCHMDLRPENIVVFPGGSANSVGIWKIIDFGISKVRKAEALEVYTRIRGRSQPQRITYTVGTKTQQLGGIYQAPEVNQQQEKVMGRRSDIWSLGCIFAEVLAANSGRLNDLRQQMRKRRGANDGFQAGFPYFFYEKKTGRGCFDPVTSTKMNGALHDELQGLPSRLPAHREALLQCTALIRRMLVAKRTSRLKARDVLGKLEGIVKKVSE